MEVILHGDLRRFGERFQVEARTPREALEKLGIPLEEVWLLAVGGKAGGLGEEGGGPSRAAPPSPGVVYSGSCPKRQGALKGGSRPTPTPRGKEKRAEEGPPLYARGPHRHQGL